MDTVYDNEFWSVTHENIKNLLDIPQELKDVIKNDEKCVALLISLFTCYKGAPKTQLFRLLLDRRDDWLTFRIPEYQKDENNHKYIGLSVLHLVLLLRPCKAYLNLLLCTPEMLELKDADGNSTLYYSIRSNCTSAYERIWKLTNSDGQSALNPGPQTCADILKADCTRILKTITLKYILDTLGGYDTVFCICIPFNATGIITQIVKASQSIVHSNGNNFVDILMKDPRVRYTTFRTVIRLILDESQEFIEMIISKYSGDVIGKRLWDLAVTPRQLKNALLVTKRFCVKTRVPSNQFVCSTGYTYDQFYLKYCNKNLHSPFLRDLAHSTINNISPKDGSYITMIAKAISLDPRPFKNCASCRGVLNRIYIPALLKMKEADWTIPDSDGITPFMYFSRSSVLEPEVLNAIQSRCDDIKIESSSPFLLSSLYLSLLDQ